MAIARMRRGTDERGERWLRGHGFYISLDSGRSIRDYGEHRPDLTSTGWTQIDRTVIEACKLGLTAAEREVYVQLRNSGATVLRHGWPDFLVITDDSTYAVEVKSSTDRINARQQQMHAELQRIGLYVDVVRV